MHAQRVQAVDERLKFEAVAPIAIGAGSFQALRTTRQVSTVVIIIVKVTAMP